MDLDPKRRLDCVEELLLTQVTGSSLDSCAEKIRSDNVDTEVEELKLGRFGSRYRRCWKDSAQASSFKGDF